MNALVSLLISAGLLAMGAGFTDQSAFFIPIPAAFAPVTKFSCPDVGTVFRYNVPAWNTNRPNRMVAIEQDQFNCRIRSDAQGTYSWFSDLAPPLNHTHAPKQKP